MWKEISFLNHGEGEERCQGIMCGGDRAQLCNLDRREDRWGREVRMSLLEHHPSPLHINKFCPKVYLGAQRKGRIADSPG